MKSLVVALLHGCASLAHAQHTTLTYEGRFWETGGFPPSVVGDRLSFVGRVTALDSRFGVDLASEEVTIVGTNFVTYWADAAGGDHYQVLYFSGATVSFYHDSTPDADFGALDPAGSVPPSFTDGNLLLRAQAWDLALNYFSPGGMGAYEVGFRFDGGSALPLLERPSPHFYPTQWFGEMQFPGQDGYDGTCNGSIGFFLVGVTPSTWSLVKQFYR